MRRSVRGMKHLREVHAEGRVTDEQKAKIEAVVADIPDGLIEVRPATYCGPGSLGDLGAWCVSRNGSIQCDVLKSGKIVW